MKNMHRAVTIVVGCILLSVSTSSAETTTKFGVKAGVSSYTFTGDAVWQTGADRKTSVSFGAFAEIGVGNNVAIQPELNYIRKGASNNYVVDVGGSGPFDVTEDVRLAYLQIPVLVKYMLPVKSQLRPSIFAGPAVSFNVSGKDDITGYGDSRDGDKDIANVRSTNFGGVVGAAVSFPLGKITGTIGARYDISFGGAFDDTDPDSVPSDEVAFLEGDVPFWDPDYGQYTNTALDLANTGFSFDFLLTFPLGK